MKKQNSTNRVNEQEITQNCPITSTMLVIGGRWKVIMLWHLKSGPLRYNEVRRAIPAISEKMLIQQLKELILAGWVDKKDYGEIPPRTEYSLTKLGESFIPILENIYHWGNANNITAHGQKTAANMGLVQVGLTTKG